MNDPFAGPRGTARPASDLATSLVEENLDYVRALARELHQKIGSSVEYDELVALGNQGLVEAARSFDPIHGASFKTFAYYRIRGAIIDGLRRMSWSRTSRAAIRHEELRDAASGELAGMADSQADVSRLEDEFIRGIRRLAVIHVVADLHDRDDVPSESSVASEALELEETRARLRAAIARLSPQDREMITALYMDCKSMTEYARDLHVNKSTVTRRHAEAIEALRRYIEEPPPEPPGAAVRPPG